MNPLPLSSSNNFLLHEYKMPNLSRQTWHFGETILCCGEWFPQDVHLSSYKLAHLRSVFPPDFDGLLYSENFGVPSQQRASRSYFRVTPKAGQIMETIGAIPLPPGVNANFVEPSHPHQEHRCFSRNLLHLCYFWPYDTHLQSAFHSPLVRMG